MGEHQVSESRNGGDGRSFMGALLRDLRALEVILASGTFESGVRRIGAEQELFLVDHAGNPALLAMDVLEVLDDPHFTTELGLFNLEFNLDPMIFGGDVLHRLEAQITTFCERARAAAGKCGGDIALVGILPTIRKSDLTMESMTPAPRYKLLNDILGALRGGAAYDFRITGVDELRVTHDNVMLEACNTSFQLHFQVGPEEFAPLYNIAQAVSAPVLAAATNSPFLLGKSLWQETRIPLFRQSIDTRRSPQHLRERSPRVHFGNSWLRESVLELFREDIARYRTLLGPDGVEDPFEQLAAGEVPRLQALRLHNGTIYRWNRPCYGITDGRPHLRIENRILPSGPTPRDEVANAAFWFGLIGGLSHTYHNIAEVFDFGAARGNFHQAARYGLSAQFEWLDGEIRPAQELILQHLLPMAREGLEDKKVDRSDIDLYLGIISDRVRAGMTGARWLTRSFTTMPDSLVGGERFGTLTTAMMSRQKEGRPVHEWPLARAEESRGWRPSFMRVEQIMTTDLYSVHEDEPLELVAQLMDWQRIRHILVEDHDNRLTGLISYRAILRVLARGESDRTTRSTPVSEIMLKDPVTVTPETPTLTALRLMREHRIGCLPVLKEHHLVGVVTEADFMKVAGNLLEEQLAEEFRTQQDASEPGD